MAFRRPLHISDLPEESRSDTSLTIVASHAIAKKASPLLTTRVRSSIISTFKNGGFDPQRLLICTFKPEDLSGAVIVQNRYRSDPRSSTTHYSKQGDTLLVMAELHYRQLEQIDYAIINHPSSNGDYGKTDIGVDRLLTFVEEHSAQTVFCRWPTVNKPELTPLTT